MQAETADEAARIFSEDFEKGGYHDERAAYAETIYEQTAIVA
jgi:hypothetical protein